MKSIIRKILLESEDEYDVEIINTDDDDYIYISKNGEKKAYLSYDYLFDSSLEYEFEGTDINPYDIFDGDVVKLSHLETYEKGIGLGKKIMSLFMDKVEKEVDHVYLNASPMGFDGLSLTSLVGFYKKFGFVEILNQGHNVLMKKDFI